MKLYLLRHGQSVANTQKVYNPLDDELSELGKQQAREAAAYMQKMHFNKAYCSTLLRARQTAELLGVKAEPVAELRDHDMGEFAGKPFGTFRLFCSSWKVPMEECRPPGGESQHEVQRRVKIFLDTLGSGDYLVVTHADLVVWIVKELTGSAPEVPIANVSLWVIEDGKVTKQNWQPWKGLNNRSAV